MVRVASITCHTVSMPYLRPFVITGGATVNMESILVVVRGDNGEYGLGETNPMTAYSGVPLEAVRAAIEEKLTPALVGCDAMDIDVAHARMDAALSGGSLAKAALDIALYDLAGKSLGVPVYKLLGGRHHDRIPIAWVVGMGTLDEMIDEARAYARRGFTLKLKVGKDSEGDVRMVHAVREAVGSQVPIRVDANAGYALDTALRVLPQMEAIGLQLIEQPLPGNDIAGMARLCAALETPIMADESLQSRADAISLVCNKAADIFNIKILKPGGLYRSRQVASVAETAGIPVMVGSMPEMGVATVAGLHFALATGSTTTYPNELIGPLMLSDDILSDPAITLDTAPGYITAPTKPGLGVTLRPAIAQQIGIA